MLELVGMLDGRLPCGGLSEPSVPSPSVCAVSSDESSMAMMLLVIIAVMVVVGEKVVD